LLGPSTFNFMQAANDALAAGAALRVENAAQALLAFDQLSRDEVRRAAMAAAAREFAAAHRGATQRTVARSAALLTEAAAPSVINSALIESTSLSSSEPTADFRRRPAHEKVVGATFFRSRCVVKSCVVAFSTSRLIRTPT